VRFAHEPLELCLLDTSLFDLHVHGDAKSRHRGRPVATAHVTLALDAPCVFCFAMWASAPHFLWQARNERL